jgi:hypothetical protein
MPIIRIFGGSNETPTPQPPPTPQPTPTPLPPVNPEPDWVAADQTYTTLWAEGRDVLPYFEDGVIKIGFAMAENGDFGPYGQAVDIAPEIKRTMISAYQQYTDILKFELQEVSIYDPGLELLVKIPEDFDLGLARSANKNSFGSYHHDTMLYHPDFF